MFGDIHMEQHFGFVCMCTCVQVRTQLQEAGLLQCPKSWTGEGFSWRHTVERMPSSDLETLYV